MLSAREGDRLAQHQRRCASLDLDLGQLRVVEQPLEPVDQLDELRGVRLTAAGWSSRLIPAADEQRRVLAAEAEGVDQAPTRMSRERDLSGVQSRSPICW